VNSDGYPGYILVEVSRVGVRGCHPFGTLFFFLAHTRHCRAGLSGAAASRLECSGIVQRLFEKTKGWEKQSARILPYGRFLLDVEVARCWLVQHDRLDSDLNNSSRDGNRGARCGHVLILRPLGSDSLVRCGAGAVGATLR